MITVCDLDCGWRLLGDPTNSSRSSFASPLFAHRDGRRRSPWEIACLPEGRQVFRALKRNLDAMEFTTSGISATVKWQVADVAKLSLQLSLIRLGRWSEDLLDTGVELTLNDAASL